MTCGVRLSVGGGADQTAGPGAGRWPRHAASRPAFNRYGVMRTAVRLPTTQPWLNRIDRQAAGFTVIVD